MKLVELLNAQPTLQRLMTQKMPAKAAYAIAKNVKMITPEFVTYDETRVKLLKENWELDPKTNQYDIPDEDREKWQKMHLELLDEEVKIDPYMIDLTTLDGVELAPNEVMAIEWMLKEK